MKTASHILIVLLMCSLQSFAGNKERIGQAGSNQLLINPWASSGGLGGSNSASVNGVESFNWNIAGLSAVGKTEFAYSNVRLFSGSDIAVNSVAIGQRVGESSVLGIGFNSFNFGNIPVTTTENPDGGLGTFSPQFLNFTIAYARAFSNSIQGGGAVRVVSESINNLGASGVALDAGIRYVYGKYDRAKFGIALRNVGPKLTYGGDGLATTVTYNDNEFTMNQRTEGFEMPALLNIGASYDMYLFPRTDGEGNVSVAEGEKPSDYRVTVNGTFTSNSFSPDQIRAGLEFGFKEYFAVRGGLIYEGGLFDPLSKGRVNANAGPVIGFAAMLPFKGKENSGFKLDYAYRFANPLGGTHAIGLKLNI
ncbi:MAG: PorV/PorQ family protein [Flavobacteriales bacterium]